MPGPVGTILQACYMLGVIAFLPAVKSLRADVEVAAGEASIVTTGIIVVKPLKSLPGFFRQLSLKPHQARGSRNYSTYYSHSPSEKDSVTNLSERNQNVSTLLHHKTGRLIIDVDDVGIA